MNILNHTNLCHNANSINDGDLLVIQRKKDKRNILVQCKKVLNRRSNGDEEVLLSLRNNDYFIWSLFEKGESWVWRVWNLGDVELTNVTNNMNEFPR